jgi:predicted flap endonuclease-1-like 5' DNA nuclease
VPPLVERFRKRDEEAKFVEAELAEQAALFETELAEANEQIAELGAKMESDETRIEPANPTSLPSDLDASNEPHAETIAGNDVPAEFRALASNNDDSNVEQEAVDTSAAADTYDGERDDLKQIKGVGPAIEKTLNELGIYRFHQISEMSEFDIDRVAQVLRGFRSRIYREDWIGQARTLRSRQQPDKPI